MLYLFYSVLLFCFSLLSDSENLVIVSKYNIQAIKKCFPDQSP
jgi:hypothetical protein